MPLGDEQGSYIAKFPSTSFPGVSENEYANLALAEAIGMEVPERERVEQSEFEGIPKAFEMLSDGKYLRGAQTNQPCTHLHCQVGCGICDRLDWSIDVQVHENATIAHGSRLRRQLEILLN